VICSLVITLFLVFPVPSGSSSSGIGLIVPLYIDPSDTTSWNTVISGASSVATIAIINPNSGPGSSKQSSYTTGIANLKNARIEVVGYVHTSYGGRAIADVESDIDDYFNWYPALNGIFVDEVSSSSSEISYYTTVYDYITAKSGFTEVIINPGDVPPQGYTAVSTKIVAFEDTYTNFGSDSAPTYGSKANFAAILESAPESDYQSVVNEVESTGIFGWIYVTDNPYGSLASYYSSEASYLATTGSGSGSGSSTTKSAGSGSGSAGSGSSTGSGSGSGGSGITVNLNPSTSVWWLGINSFSGETETTSSVAAKDSSSANTWWPLTTETWGWDYTPDNEFVAPLSLKLTSTSGDQVILTNVITSVNGGGSFTSSSQYP